MTNDIKNKVEDVVIVGGGPAGLAAALYNARANLNPLIIAGSPPGGQLMLTSDVENYPGFESILGPELIETYRKHVQKFGTRIIDENVLEVDFSKAPFKLKLLEKEILAKTVIIATGAKALWLGLENEQRLRGRGVSACATCDGFFFKEKTVVVVGGGDTAMEEALTLTKFASKVYVIHRRDSFRASKIMQDRVMNHEKIEVIWNTEVVDVLGQDKVEGVRLKETEAETGTRELKTDALFMAIGHKPDTDIFKDKIDLDSKGYVTVTQRVALELLKSQNPNSKDQTSSNIQVPISKFNTNYQYMTSVDGVFAAGDCVDYVYRQAATAVGMGVAAALEVERYLETQD